MKESVKKKFDSIDQSKIKVESTKEILAKIKSGLNSKDEENQKKAETLLDTFISKAKAKNADIFKEQKPEKPQTAQEKKETKSKLDEVMDIISKDPMFKDFNSPRRIKGGGKSDALIDSQRKAKESGFRISKKGWKNQYGASDGGRKYYEYRENRIDRKAPNYGSKPWLKDGGFIHPSDKFENKFSVIEIKDSGDRKVHNTFPDFETAMAFASLKRNVMPSQTKIIVENKDGVRMYSSFRKGGKIDESTEMLLSQNKEIAHHTKELKNTLSKKPHIEPWVVAKIERAATDMSDVTHYLDGQTEYAKGGYMAKGGEVKVFNVGDKVIYAPNGKFFSGNRPNYKEGVISDIAISGATKLYTIKIENRFGVVTDLIQTSNIKELDKFAKGGYMDKGGDTTPIISNFGKEGTGFDNPKYKGSYDPRGVMLKPTTDLKTLGSKLVVTKLSNGSYKWDLVLQNGDIYQTKTGFNTSDDAINDYMKSSYAKGGYMANDDYEKGFESEKTYLDEDDFAKIDARVEKEYLEKDRKSGVHDKFTKYWYNGGREKAIAKYGEDESKAWEEAYEDFKDDFYKMAKGGYMAEGGQLRSYKTFVEEYPDKKIYVRVKFAGADKDVQNYTANEENKKRAISFAKRLAEKNNGTYEGFKIYTYAKGGYMAKGGIVVTSIKDIPNFEERLNQGRITYRGLGVGKLSNDFYNIAGEGGKMIKVDGKEYYITDTEFNSFSRDADGMLRVKFAAPKRKFERGGYMARGGQVEFLYSDSNFDNKYYKRFNGAIGSFAWIYEKRYNEGILYPLDAFDLDYYAHLPLKENEVILRYQSDRMRDVDSSMYLIKFNVKKMLVYFMEDAYSDDDKNIKFSPKGLKLEYLTIEWQSLSSKQQMNIDLDKFDKGGKVDASYSVWVRKGASDDEEVVKSNLTKSEAKKLMDSLWDKDEYYEIGMSSSTYGNGGTLKDYDQLIGKTILIYSMGVKTPNSYKISGVIPPDPKFSVPTLKLETGNTEERIEGKAKIQDFINGEQIELYDGKEYYAIKLASSVKLEPKSGDYTKRRNLKLIIIKNPNKNGSKNYLMIDKRDFLNGLHKFEGGGNLSKEYTYIKRADVNQVVYRDSNGKETIDSKPKNGFWVSKKALVEAGMNDAKVSFDAKEVFNELATLSNQAWDKLSIQSGSQIYNSNALQKDLADEYEKIGIDKIYKKLTKSERKKVSDILTDENEHSLRNYLGLRGYNGEAEYKNYVKNYEESFAKFGYRASWNPKNVEIEMTIFKEGGKIGFESLSKKVAKNYVGKKVDPKYQDEYGKTYDKEEAKEVGDKVAAKVYRQQLSKMEDGGALPEKMENYFIKTRKTKLLKMSDLLPNRARPEGIVNAEKYMRLAAEGKKEKRKPITVYHSARNYYRIYDGNSTYAVAKQNGWENIWAEVIKNPNRPKTGKPNNQVFMKAKEIRKDGENWKDAVKRAAKMLKNE